MGRIAAGGGMAKAQRMIARGAGLGWPLTERERTVVLALMEGHTCAKELARALSLSHSSVSNYLYRIYAKSGALNMAHLVLMMTGAVACPDALLPVQRTWRRKHYKLEQI